MSKEKATISEELSAKTYLIIMLSSVVSTIIFAAAIIIVVPLEPWLTYALIGAVLVSEAVVLGIIYSRYRKALNPSSGGLVSSGFGEQRPDIGSKSPSRRN